MLRGCDVQSLVARRTSFPLSPGLVPRPSHPMNGASDPNDGNANQLRRGKRENPAAIIRSPEFEHEAPDGIEG